MSSSLAGIIALVFFAVQVYMAAIGKPLIPQPKVFPWVSMDTPNAFDPIPPRTK